jgi:hypothetical protein
VSPLDGINGARPAFIGPEKRSTVAAAEQMASQPKRHSGRFGSYDDFIGLRYAGWSSGTEPRLHSDP